MHSHGAPPIRPTVMPDGQTRRSVLRWYAGGAVTAVAMAFVAARLNLWGIAPVGLLPIGVGILFGTILCALAAQLHVTGGMRLLLGTIALAIFVVLAEHAWLYHDFRRQWHEAREESAEVAMFRPETPWTPAEYFGREASAHRLVLWVCDAALIVAAATVTVVFMGRQSRTKARRDSTQLVEIKQRSEID
jgi:hypothetical protein